MLCMPRSVPSKAKPLSVRIDAELLSRTNRFIARQQFPITLTAVMETALRQLLDRHESEVQPPKPKR